MAAWHFKTRVLPLSGLRAVYGSVPSALPTSRPHGSGTASEDAGEANAQPTSELWANVASHAAIEGVFSALLPESESWSSHARMFGDEMGSRVELWKSPDSGLIEDICIFFSMSVIDPKFLTAALRTTRSSLCALLDVQAGLIFDPDIPSFITRVRASSALRYADDGVLEMLATG